MLEIPIRGEYITLGQLLKVVGELNSGGQVKEYLATEMPLVNGQIEQRRGRKLRPGDKITLKNKGEIILANRSACHDTGRTYD
jgi:ribosome-associated protein